MAMGGRICPLCGCVNQPSLCPSCINHMAHERQRMLKRLGQTRARLRDQLDAQLGQRQELDRQRLWRREQGERLERLRAALSKAKGSLATERALVEGRQCQLSASSDQLVEAHRQLLAKKTELLEHYFPDLLRIKSLGQAKLAMDAAALQRSILKQLCNIFPLRLPVVDVPEAWDGQEKLTQAVRICGVRLPDGEDPLTVPAPELSASLGYLLQFLALAARYLAAPLLHSAGFAASSSRIWQRASYWNPRAASVSQQLPLYLPRPGSSSTPDAGPADSPSGTSPPFEAPFPSNRGEASSPTGPGTGGGAQQPPPGGQSGASLRQLRLGIRMLRRSVACVCAQQEAAAGVPPFSRDLPSFAAFALLMALLMRDPRWGGSGLLARSSQGDKADSSGRAPGARPQHGAFLLGRQGQPDCSLVLPPERSGARSMATEEDTEANLGESSPEKGEGREVDEERSLEGWDLVERPPLPPPPSRAEDVEHWTRAMFVDAKK